MRCRVLIVEDNHDLRVDQRIILEEKGFEVYSATNGKDALKLIQEGLEPEVIVLDLVMPLMDGEEFLSRFQALKPQHQSQVLIVSGSLGKAKDLNTSRYNLFPKPIIMDEFARTVRDLIPTA